MKGFSCSDSSPHLHRPRRLHFVGSEWGLVINGQVELFDFTVPLPWLLLLSGQHQSSLVVSVVVLGPVGNSLFLSSLSWSGQ